VDSLDQWTAEDFGYCIILGQKIQRYLGGLGGLEDEQTAIVIRTAACCGLSDINLPKTVAILDILSYFLDLLS
jgi:hypothetical protein